MSLKIKNKSLVVKTNKKPSGEINLVIKRQHPDQKRETKLSDVLHELPAGIVFKDETGMGATHLELLASRNSIIVEPIKITASSKAYKSNALYVGSATKFHPKAYVSDTDIILYLSDASIKYKKIVAVADSLPRVISIVREHYKKDLRKWFLLIDEIDTFQMDSTYRNSMEYCLDIFDFFSPSNRTLLSATQIEFSDERLQSEKVTRIIYDKPAKRNINIKVTDTVQLHGVSVDTVIETLKKHPAEKIFVAYNSVKGCKDLADHLVKNANVSVSDIAIYCSANSKGDALPYYSELDSDQLKGKVNFFTSAYFSGFDIEESYHLVSISSNRNIIYALSEKKLKQIAGRCRTKLLSEIIIHDTYTGELKDYHTKESLVEAANAELLAFRCMHNHYLSNAILETFYKDIFKGFFKVLDEKKLKLVRTNIDEDYEISYMNIDAILEQQRVRVDLYMSPDSLTNLLKEEGHNITKADLTSYTKVESPKQSTEQKNKEVGEIIDKLKDIITRHQIDDLILEEGRALSSLQKSIALTYKNVVGLLDHESTLGIFKDSILKNKNIRNFKKVAYSALLQTLPDDHLIKERFAHYFPLKKRFTSDELESRMDLFLKETHLNLTFDVSTKKKTVQAFSFFCSYYTKTLDGIMMYTIKDYNPFKFIVKKKRKSMKDASIFETLKSYFE